MGITTGAAGMVRAGFVTIGGGVLIILGTLLPFATVSTTVPGVPTQNIDGLDTGWGKIFLLIGLGIAILGVIILLTHGLIPRILGVLALVGGGVVVVRVLIDLFSFGDAALREIAEVAAAEDPSATVAQFLQLYRELGLSVDPGIGLFVLLVAGLLSMIGGVWALLTRTPASVPAAPPPPSMGRGLVGEGTEPAQGTSPVPSPEPDEPPTA